ncbi:MAG TPA: ABC transporter permease [Dongiaceae bacterium]|nr:ABC transporter permease [Dongiaceae bacterium]
MIRRSDGWLLAPSLAIVTCVLLAPMALLLVISFWSVRSFKLQPDFTFAAWERFFVNYGELTLYTLLIGVVTAALCIIVGMGFAYAVRFKAGRYADALVMATMITLFGGYLVKIYAWKSILGADGLLNQALMKLGILDAPAPWLLYSRGAVIITLMHFLLPFAILPLYGALRNVSPATLEAARDLGATPVQTFWRVVVPQCRAGLFAAFAFIFLLAAGDYVTPLLIGGTSGSMLGQFIALEFSTRFNWPAGAAMSFGLLGASLLVLGLLRLAAARRRRA